MDLVNKLPSLGLFLYHVGHQKCVSGGLIIHISYAAGHSKSGASLASTSSLTMPVRFPVFGHDVRQDQEPEADRTE